MPAFDVNVLHGHADRKTDYFFSLEGETGDTGIVME